MSSTTTELIKQKLDIVEFLRGYLQLSSAGKNFKARCPFHNEKTPSFMVSPDRQSWKCFGCGAGGDIFGFLMKYENLEFGEALRILAEKAGVELKRLNPQEYKLTGLLYELNEKAKEYFRNSLKNAEPAKKYLADRRLRQATVDEFELGWSPNEFEGLSVHLLNAGYSPDDLLRAGLSVKTSRGLLTDRFRGRIMFPIHNHFGRVVGFTGRILDLPRPERAERVEEPGDPSTGSTGSPQARSGFVAAKYINSPETAIFQKSRLLYGFWKSKNHIRETGSVFLVEGQMDFLMSWQAGIKNAVATSGTSLTGDHLRALRRLTEEVVLSFDEDEAGAAAAERAIDMLEAGDFSVKVVSFSKFKDPAEAAENDPEGLRRAVLEAVPAPEFYFRRYLPAEEPADYKKRDALKKLRLVLVKIKSISSPVERSFWMRELSRRTGLKEDVLAEEADKIEASRKTSDLDRAAPAESRRITRRELIGERLLRAGAAAGNFAFTEECRAQLAFSHQKVLELLIEGKKRSDDPHLDEIMSAVVLGPESLSPSEIDELKRELKKECIKEKKTALAAAVRRAEESGDEAKLRSALSELNNLSPVTES